MTVVRIVLICLAAALMCAMLRFARPEMAMAISLSVSLIALLLTRFRRCSAKWSC